VAFVPLARSKERLVRVDEQHRVSCGAFGRHDGPHVRTLGLHHFGGVFLGDIGFTVHEQVIDRVPVESEHIPGFEMRQQPGMHLRIVFEEIVHPIGKRIEQLPDLGVRSFVFRFGQAGDLQGPDDQVVIERLLPVNLGGASQGANVAIFDLPEIVLGLRVCVAEGATGIGRPEDMGNAVRVPVDGYGMCRFRGAVNFRGRQSACRKQEQATDFRHVGECESRLPSLAECHDAGSVSEEHIPIEK
jgi:hypothetical protein